MRIAYITFDGIMHYTPANGFNEVEDLLPFLQKKGLDISSEIWDDPNVDWEQYDVILLKTPWDYHRKFEQFNVWLEKIERLNIKLLNDYLILRWNMDKHYLKDIIEAGFNVIPSLFLDQGWKDELEPLFEKLSANKLIVKPCISGGSTNTFVLSADSIFEDKKHVLELISRGDYIVQPFIQQIKDGEWSFVFLDGQYSHAIIKKPKAGDFRVQQVFGGTIEIVCPEQKYIDYAASYVSAFAGDTLYARVDGVMVNGKFMLMELELVEPFLYLSYQPDAVEQYFQALVQHLATSIT